MRGHHEVSNGDRVACSELTSMVGQVFLHDVMVLLGQLDVSLDRGGLLVGRGEHET